MSLRPCIGTGGRGCATGQLVKAGRTRCPDCARWYEQARGSSTARGYGSAHQRQRADYQRRMDTGRVYTCWRPACGKPIDPSNWTLGHCDDYRTTYHGPECPPCDYATSGRTGCPHPSH